MAWPTTSEPKTEFVTVRFTVREAQLLDEAAARSGLKRSEFLRKAVERVLAADAKRQKKISAGTEGEQEPDE